MSREDFIVNVFCFVDDFLSDLSRGQRLRQRGPEPRLADSEVITMEIVGEFLGMDKDEAIYGYFTEHWSSFFPNLPDRSTFVRQAANLMYWKQRLQRRFAQFLGAFDDDVHLTDGLPIPVCGFSRAHFSKLFKGSAAYGYCAAKKETYFGFHGHLVVSMRGVVTGFELTAANIDERDVLPQTAEGLFGLMVGDKGLIRPQLKEDLSIQGLDLETPLRRNMHDDRDPQAVKQLMRVRRRIETVIGQFTERFHIEKVRARDLWHLCHRIGRKLLAHTVAMFLSVMLGRSPMEFDGLVA
jgi:hypothetical protein